MNECRCRPENGRGVASGSGRSPCAAVLRAWRGCRARRRGAPRGGLAPRAHHPGPPPTIQAVFLWIGFASFVAATVVFVFLFFLHGKREHYVLNFFCVAIAALGYFANANGMGFVNVNSYTVNFARYLDWSITTPLLVIDLAELGERPFAIKLTLVFADFLMIATGLFCALCPAPMRWGFFAFSCLFFLVLLFILYQGYARTLRLLPTDRDRNMYRVLIIIFLATWNVYPVIFVIGTEGIRTLNPDVEVIILTFTDLTAKVIFGFIYLKLEDNKYEADIEKRVTKEVVFFEDENGVKYVRAQDGIALDEQGKIRA
nr:protein 72 [synthetic construct]